MLSSKRDTKILFVYQALDSWVKKDLIVLRERYSVREIHFKKFKDIFRILKGVYWADITFSWFGKLHAFFAVLFSKLLKKKSIVVAGGDDVACVPEIKYGMFSYWWKKWCPLFVFRYTDVVLTVSNNTTEETINNAKVNQNKIKRIYHGFDHNTFKKESIKKKNLAITVGGVSWEYIKRKGIELFVRSASELEEISFYLIGDLYDESVKYLNDIASSNVYFLGRVPDDELKIYMGEAKVYVQVSFHEGFGCSLAEAMLCECVPVVSRYGAIPEVVGDVGIYVDDLTPKNVAEKIKYALTLSDDYGKKARNRIIEKFPLSKRKQHMVEIIEKVGS